MKGCEHLRQISSKRKEKLSFPGMINQLESKGIKFNDINKEKAQMILEENNYYYKISAYKYNYEKNYSGKYVNLDFAYLYDLSTIDMRLRYVLIHMCLDIEHALKVKILKDITNNDQEDGYNIVNQFLTSENLNVRNCMPVKTAEDHYSKKLYDRHESNPPIWVLFETMTFGIFVRFVEFYTYRYATGDKYYEDISAVLRYIKNIRNAAAHSQPILMDIAESRNDRTSRVVADFVLQIPEIGKKSRNNKMRNRKVHDIVALFYAYHTYIKSEGMKYNRYKDVEEILTRCKRNGEYYQKNNRLTTTHDFFSKIVDFVKQDV